MSYNKFQYWVRGPRHKKLGIKFGIQARIKNGDFEYPSDVKKDLLNQKKNLEKRMEEYVKECKKKGMLEESIRENINQIFKKTRVSILKVEEELLQEELTRLDEFKQACFINNYPFLDVSIKQMVWDNILKDCLEVSRSDDNRINNTSDFYNEYNNRIEKYGMEDNLKRIEEVLKVRL